MRERAPRAQDFTQAKGHRGRALSARDRERNRTESKVRVKVEHPFHALKCRFGYTKARYKGLAKNAKQVFALCALVNLVLAKKRLLRCWQP